MGSRSHVEDVPHSHVGLPMTVPLTDQLLFGPGHMYPVRSGRDLVIQNGMGLGVSVMNELSLKRKQTHCLPQKTTVMFSQDAVSQQVGPRETNLSKRPY